MEQGNGQRARAPAAVACSEWMRGPAQLSSSEEGWMILSTKILTTLPAVDWPPRGLQFYWTSPEVAALTQQMWVVALPGAGVLFEINNLK